ncbi:MAG TPA: hypothetical protein VN603_09355 [Candidatus Acidoferrales bacterium]|nr:hypothetical protein [Candidatus Acidoferrales bacterium]
MAHRPSFLRSPPLALLPSLFLVAACGTYATFTPLHVPPHELSPRSPESVDLIIGRATPQRPVALIGVLSSGDASVVSGATRNDALEALRAKAAEVGCDAVWVTSENDEAFRLWVTTSQYRIGDWEYQRRELRESIMHHFHGSCLAYVAPARDAK